MLFMERVVEVVSACERVDFAGELAYVGALLFEIGGPPSFLVRGWFGVGYMFFDSSVDGVFEVLEGRFEFGDGVKGVRWSSERSMGSHVTVPTWHLNIV